MPTECIPEQVSFQGIVMRGVVADFTGATFGMRVLLVRTVGRAEGAAPRPRTVPGSHIRRSTSMRTRRRSVLRCRSESRLFELRVVAEASTLAHGLRSSTRVVEAAGLEAEVGRDVVGEAVPEVGLQAVTG